jgi:acyl-CoA thioesterase FadM
MAKIKIDLPLQFPFTTTIPVRITDLNYGNHVGNDSVLSIIHEARMQFLKSLGYSELDMAGTGMIMSDVGIEFKAELFYGDTIIASVACAGITRIGFDLYYKLETVRSGAAGQAGKPVLVAAARTGMVCFNYSIKKIVAIPQEALVKLQAL